ncbi:MAG: site-specific DNA-methyltransferase [Planctomycetota bacterium]|jgi:site-specific DNA-methyltransferase (adenine-specific)|nr:site-specific DNA-methyltransferase [Planctomycetota bacterium]
MSEQTINLFHGDTFQIIKEIPDRSVDLIFADPPYNLSGAGFLTVQNGKPVACDKGKWDKIDDIHAFNREWLRECLRVLSDSGTLWISGTLHNHPSIGVLLKELGFWLINDIVWFKRNAAPLLVTNRFAPSTELIWLAAKSKKYFFNYDVAKEMNGGRQMKNLWEIPAQRHKTIHPTEKPEVLLERILLIGSKPDATIFDPFMGSGTTGAVAKRLGRNFIGCEIDNDYFMVATVRIAETENELATALF